MLLLQLHDTASASQQVELQAERCALQESLAASIAQHHSLEEKSALLEKRVEDLLVEAQVGYVFVRPQTQAVPTLLPL